MAESWEMSGRERRYSVPVLANNNSSSSSYREGAGRQNTAEDLHAWSIYRQNLNSDFADSALGSNEKAPLPYGNFQLDSSTIQSILNHPKCGPKSELSSNTNAYLKFGLPRVVARSGREESSGYDSSNDGSPSLMRSGRNHLSKSDPDFRKNIIASHPNPTSVDTKWSREQRRMKSISEANLLSGMSPPFIHWPRPFNRSHLGVSHFTWLLSAGNFLQIVQNLFKFQTLVQFTVGRFSRLVIVLNS